MTVQVGRIISDGENVERDAIHVAIMPVRAYHQMAPGTPVRFFEDIDGPDTTKVVEVIHSDAIGVIDPLLPGPVETGQMVYMWMKPNTITSLRHEWTHPDLDAGLVAESKRWLKEFCNTHDCVSYEILVAAAKDELSMVDEFYGCSVLKNTCDDYWTFYGRDAHCDVPPELWVHLERVVGKAIHDKVSYFSCSC